MSMLNTQTILHNRLKENEEWIIQQRQDYEEIRNVLETMVYDIEVFEHENEVNTLRHELAMTTKALNESTLREEELLTQHKEMSTQIMELETKSKSIATKIDENLKLVHKELAKKQELEMELQNAKDQLSQSAKLSTELANAQREIRDLQRSQSLYNLLRTGDERILRKSQSLTPRNAVVPTAVSNNSISKAQSNNNNKESETSGTSHLEVVVAQARILRRLLAYVDRTSFASLSCSSKYMHNRLNSYVTVMRNEIKAQKNMSTKALQQATTPSAAKTTLNLTWGTWGLPTNRPRANSNASSSSMTSLASSHPDTTTQVQQSSVARADILVKSLKKDELKIFADMSTRIKTLEAHYAALQAEKEDISARLNGAENVRVFLMEKLQKLETEIANVNDVNRRQNEQMVIDRQIIGYLDIKSQDYECSLQDLAKENEELRVTLAQAREEHSSKLAVLYDMMGLVTSERDDLGIQLRSQRKVLVKEVKALRAQNEELLHEKNHYYKQLMHLKQALQQLNVV